MAQQGVLLEKEQFCCSVCLGLLKEPVAIPCGHSYCRSCIESYWDQDDQGIYSCPQCNQTFTPRPTLRKNNMLAEVVETLKKTGLQAVCYAGPGDVACDFCTGTRKQKALMSCLVCVVSYCETHVQPHYDVPVLKKHKLVKATAQLQENICSHHDQLLEVYCRTDQQWICYHCVMDKHKGHDTVPAAAERTEIQSQLGMSQQKVQQRVQEREKVLKDIQQAVESLKHSANAAVEDSERIFTELIRSMEERRFEVKELIRAQEKAEVSRAEGLLEQLEQEIAELRRRDAELEQLSHTEDHIHFLQSYQSLSSPSVSSVLPSIVVRPLQYFGDVSKSVSELREKVEDLLKGEWTKISTTGIAGHNNHSSQMKAALQQDDPMEDKDRGQEVERHPSSEFPVGNLVDIDNTPVAKSLHGDNERERDGEREKEKERQKHKEMESEKKRDGGREVEMDGARVGERDGTTEKEMEGAREEAMDIGWESERDGTREGVKDEEEKRLCCSLSELKKVPQCHVELEPLSFSRTHNVLIDVNEFHHKGTLTPQSGHHVWHSDFVKMPCSPESLIKTGRVISSEQSRWEVVSKQLESLAKKTTASVGDVEKAIKKYNPRYEAQWSFDALHTFVKKSPKEEKYYMSVFPKIAELASSLPHYIKKAIPLLQKGQTQSITLTQSQIACLLANAFYCTFPHRNSPNPRAEYHNYPTINFNSLFEKWSERKREKLRALLHYFHTVTDPATRPSGLVTFERRYIRDRDMPIWESCKETVPKLHVTSAGCIEEQGAGMLQVDFACNMIGGGVLGSGLVQEEILFLMNPELIVSRLFTEKLGDNECLFITGSQQFSQYSGYSDTFKWVGPHRDNIERDEWQRLHRQIVAMDALHFRNQREQYNMRQVTRELNKAYCGFKADDNTYPDFLPDIATGNWASRAFNGDPKLKALIQLMAAARAKRGVAFFTFNNLSLERELQNMHHLLVTHRTTVGELYELLVHYCAVIRSAHTHVDLFDWIRSQL
ncbi:poly(ADP-ribose) glycohydrolase-like isoform X1 [Salmo trutta]|uniref:poly(ADP-ribose) glycohydrolase-like isoform X1 n=1 Tax=Salmo trutta TaxID=8032 RepID=UPI001130AE49|nr:poly(ADP-ribose) glycohydrolase-like isoform X1 [Salmo trutta]